MKRIFDITMSIGSLLILFPIFVFISIIIFLDNKGPVFFKQKRIGLHGQIFILYKFRSMSVVEAANDGLFEPGNTSRVTTIGKILRKTKLDELPQLYNVLIGDMSLVGPRPEVEKWVTIYPAQWKKVLSVKPGITDNASILFKNEESILAASDDPESTYKNIILPKKLELYEKYVKNHSFYGDLTIIFKTFIQIIFKNR